MPSKVGATFEASALDYSSRRSEQTWIGPGQRNETPLTERLRHVCDNFARLALTRQRILNLTKLSEEVAEDLQIVRYEKDNYYRCVGAALDSSMTAL